MTHYKSEAKSASSAKMKRMGLNKEHKTPTFDGFNSWDGEPGLDSGNAGKMPITKSKFKRGGKVAHVEGEKAKHHLGKKPRLHKTNGGPIPVPPRRDDDNYDPYPYKLTKAQQSYLYNQEHPDDTPDAGTARSTNARGGMIGATPSQRKKIVGALVSRKKKEGMSAAILKGFGVPRDIKAPIGALSPMKKGGRAHHHHEDEAEDRALIRKEVKPSALKHRSHKYGGGPITSQNPMMNMGAQGQAWDPTHMHMNPGAVGQGFGQKQAWDPTHMHMNPGAMGNMPQAPAQMGPAPIYQSNPMTQAPLAQGPNGMFNKGGRVQRATGGRTKAGKTNVNIIISPQSGQGQQPLGAGVGMGQPPVPPVMPPMPPQGMPPMGGMPPQGMPPQGMPPMPPGGGGGPFKKGGRVGMPKYQETEFGSGSGLGRLEKRKWPKANGTP